MRKARLKKYAELIVKRGVNVQEGQEVFITAELDQPSFVELVVKECYVCGAKRVFVDWTHQPIDRLDAEYCTEEVLGTVEDFQIKRWEHQANTIPCKIYLLSEDPDGLSGVDQRKYATAMAKRAKTVKPIRARMENKYQWCIAAVPGKKWAKKIFPNDKASTAVNKLWDLILDSSRVDSDPIEAWRIHNETLAKRCEYLNSLGIKELKYKASNGTDLRVGLLPEAEFQGGGEYALESRIYFNPNIPSEEIFTSPKRGDADGIVYSSKPLSYGGQLIDNFFIRFENGKAVEVGAEKNEELLREIIGMDEGAAYLGECALVPFSSPIQRSGVLFYNTLFDENAACHLALGRGFTNLIKGYERFTEEELHKMGINDSVVHEDFMIGTQDLSIIAVTDTAEVKIFENGEWAF